MGNGCISIAIHGTCGQRAYTCRSGTVDKIENKMKNNALHGCVVAHVVVSVLIALYHIGSNQKLVPMVQAFIKDLCFQHNCNKETIFYKK